MNDEAVYRTAPATPGLLITLPLGHYFSHLKTEFYLNKEWNIKISKTKSS